MTNEELEQVYDCLDGGFGETSGKLSAHIKALEAENERLKAENKDLKSKLRDNGDWICNGNEEQSTILKQRISFLEKEKAKLKCLALHGMIGYAVCKMNVLAEEYEKEFASGMVHKDFSRWHRLSRLWLKAYRKAKKELMEGK